MITTETHENPINNLLPEATKQQKLPLFPLRRRAKARNVSFPANLFTVANSLST